MDQLMRWLAPRTVFGFILRFAMFIGLVGAANYSFTVVFDVQLPDTLEMAALHALVVGGPFVAFFLAVTFFQVRLQSRLWHLSRKDGLTGLNNRRTFFERTSSIRAVSKTGMLLVIDADWFKRINDEFGHLAGDKCLKSIAYTLERNVRQTDVVGRLGGEEFAIYLPGATAEHARVIGERLTKPITFHTGEDYALSVTLSIGAAVSNPALSLDALFARADKALYRAKADGRATFVLWSEDTDTKASAMPAPRAIPVST